MEDPAHSHGDSSSQVGTVWVPHKQRSAREKVGLAPLLVCSGCCGGIYRGGDDKDSKSNADKTQRARAEEHGPGRAVTGGRGQDRGRMRA